MSNSIIAKKANVAPLYVYRRVLNAADIIEWAKANGFEKCVPPEEMHVTIAHSSDPVDWAAAGDSFDSLIAEGGKRSVVPLGDKGAVVLKFQLGELDDRWQEFRDAGASWDFPGYQPHVTLTYKGAGVDLSGIEPFDGPIKFGPEIFEPMTDGWSDALVEKQRRIIKVEQIDEELGLVFGWAIICTEDGQPYFDLNIDRNEDGTIERVPENVPELAMMKAGLIFAEGPRPGNVMHKGPDVGSYPFLFPMTAAIAKSMNIITKRTGLMCGFKPPADIMAKYKSGEFTGFSIEGNRVSYEEVVDG